MPVTPFHFGPAAIVKSASSQWFSLTVFGLTQVIIDLEPLYYMAQGMWPIHRFLHTYLGAAIVAVVAAVAGKPLCEWFLRLWNERLSDVQRRWLSVEPAITRGAAFAGSLFGGFSHILLDSVMHSDIRPFAPWSDTNGLLYAISIGTLYELCAVTGLLGLLWLAILLARRWRAAAGDGAHGI